MSAIVEASIDDTRFTMLVLSGFAVAALLLAGVGLYGTLSYLMSQRTQELGVRIALGASAIGVMRLVAHEGGILAGVGGAIGLAGAFGVTRTLRGLLYGVTPLDGVTMQASSCSSRRSRSPPSASPPGAQPASIRSSRCAATRRRSAYNPIRVVRAHPGTKSRPQVA